MKRADERLSGIDGLGNGATSAARQRRAAVFLCALLPLAALADTVVVSGGGVFTATDANQFGAGPATIVDVGFNTDPLFLGFQFDTGPVGFDGIADTVVGSFGLAFDARFAGRAGLEVGYYFDSGSVDARYPFNFAYQYLDTAGIQAAIAADPSWNRRIDLGASFGQSGQTFLRTNFPEVGAYADFVLELQASAKIEGCVFGCVGFDLIPSFLRDVDAHQELFAFNRPDPVTGEPDGNLRIFGLGSVPFETSLEWGSDLQPSISDGSSTSQSGKAGGGAGIVVEVSNIGFNQPISVSAGVGYGPISATTELANLTLRMPQELDMEGTVDASSGVPRLGASASDSIVDFRLDMDGIAGGVVPFIPPGEVTLSLGPASLSLNLFDYELGPQLALSQTVSLAPEPTLRLLFDQPINIIKNDVVERTDYVDVRLGMDDIAIQFPNRELNVTPSFSLNAKFANDLDLDLTLSQTLTALGLSADFAGLGGFELGPLYTRDDELARTKLADLVDTRFDLTGTIEQAVNLSLSPFTLGEGWRLSGESADIPRYAASVLADGTSQYHFRFDATDLAAGPSTVYVSYFGSEGDTYRSLHDYLAEECDIWFIGCLDWDTISEEHTTQAIYAAHADDPPSPFPGSFTSEGRTYSIVNPAASDSRVTLPDQTPLAVAASNSPNLVPADLRDYHYADSGDFAGIFRWSESSHIYYSDLVDVLASKRYGGYGMTDPVYLAFSPLDTVREGDDYVTRFAQAVDFDVASFVDNATGYEFESLTLPGDRFADLLGLLGDSDGIGLQVWDGAAGDWTTLTSWIPTAGTDFHFNFFDDYLRTQLGPDSYLVSAQDNWAVDGIAKFRLSDLDLTLADLDLDELLDRFGPGGTESLVAGITVTDLVTQEGLTGTCWYFWCGDAAGLHGPLPGSSPDYMDFFPYWAFGQYYAGTRETIHDPTTPTSPGLDLAVRPGELVALARTPVETPPTPQPEPGLGPVHDASVPPENVPPEATPTCTGTQCESNSITDPDSGTTIIGTGFQELVEKGYVNATGEPNTGQHPPPPPQPDDPTPPPGSHPTLALGPTGGNDRDVFVFDFSQIDFGGEAVWGGPLVQRDLVFDASATLPDGTPCGAATSSFADGQVVNRSVAGMGPAYLQFDTGGRSAAEFAGCFATVESTATFGQDAPVYLAVPFAPTYDFSVDGPLFTSILLPYEGDNALLDGLVDVLLFDVGLDEFVRVATLGLGDQFFFDGEGVDRFRLTGLNVPYFWLDHDPAITDANPLLIFGLMLSEPGTVINAWGSGFPAAAPEPASWALMVLGLLLLRRQLQETRRAAGQVVRAPRRVGSS